MKPKPGLFYGWIIMVLAFMAITTYGLFFSFGVFLEPLEEELQTSRAAISAVYTIFVAVYCISAILMGRLSDKYGSRKTLLLAAVLIGGGISLCSLATSVWQLYIYFGIIAGIGHGAIFVVPTSVLSRWFIKKKGLVVGIAISGLGGGLLIVPPLTSQVIDLYGWRVAFVLLGATFFVINGIVAAFIRNRPQDMGLRPYGETEWRFISSEHLTNTKDYPVSEAIRTKVFRLLYFICLFAFAAEQMVVVHIVPYSTGMGISPIAASLGLSLLGVGTIFGRIIGGFVSDRIGRVNTLIMCCAIEAACIFFLLAINSPLTLYITMLFLGIGYGGWVVLGSLILSDYFGEKNLGMIMGVWFSSGLPAGVFGPLLGGILFDYTKSYVLALIMAGTVCIVAVILSALIKPNPKTRG